MVAILLVLVFVFMTSGLVAREVLQEAAARKEWLAERARPLPQPVKGVPVHEHWTGANKWTRPMRVQVIGGAVIRVA